VRESFDPKTANSRHPFLAGMSVAHLNLLAEQAMHARFEAGKMIPKAGDPANRFYAIEQGRAAIESGPSSHPVLIELVDHGDLLCWSWL
jgi:CRP-like cAMP-binding protein